MCLCARLNIFIYPRAIHSSLAIFSKIKRLNWIQLNYTLISSKLGSVMDIYQLIKINYMYSFHHSAISKVTLYVTFLSNIFFTTSNNVISDLLLTQNNWIVDISVEAWAKKTRNMCAYKYLSKNKNRIKYNFEGRKQQSERVTLIFTDAKTNSFFEWIESETGQILLTFMNWLNTNTERKTKKNYYII